MKNVIVIIVMLLCFYGGSAAAQTPNDAIQEELFEGLSVEAVNRFIDQINRELNQDLPGVNPDTLRKIADQGLSLDWNNLWREIGRRFFSEISQNLNLMGKLLFLAVLCALLQNLQSSFESSTVSLLAYGICFIFLITLVLAAFYQITAVTRSSVEYMVGFMQALLPLMMSLLAGVGALTSAALFTPFMLFVISSVSVVIKDIVLPLLFLAAVVDCINYLSDKYRISNLAGLIKQGGMIVLGLTMVLFIGIITVQGVIGGVSDGLTLRTAKFATATFIPVVGKMFADTVELVMGASLVLKNAIGVLGVLVIATLCFMPILKLVSLIVIVKSTGALIQPLGAEKMAQCLENLGNNLLLVLGALLTVALMFFLSITMIIGAGNITMMMR
ncbi:stage III sporulation protein AE [Acetonema longum]|uniref:Stage iii sporulation protein ae, putative n=1 Tax=Acetonema longum DSM 6540 TaxID=1009370 RepID=F7NJX4_9FIRM|nr:stage III sporulation protein AE [Acetonema longum]EGO63621.1 stage iii sporulation protein ae, putative [Acetonema longum DSM 6540]